MKKLLSVIVLAAMLVTMICPSFAAADGHDHSDAESVTEVKEFDTLTFSVDDAVVGRDAKTVDVNVRVAGNGEHNCPTGIWGLGVSLYYPGDLKAVDIKNGTLFPAAEAGFDMEKWNAVTPDSTTKEALDENGVDVEGKDYRYGRFTAEQTEYSGGTLDNGVLFTVTFELPEGAKAGDKWEIGIAANKEDVCDCGVEKVDEEGNKTIVYNNIPFSLDNGSVEVTLLTRFTVADATANLGCEFTVPVTLTDNPGMFITRLVAEYDANKLEFVRADNGEVFADGTNVIATAENGLATLYFESAGDTNVEGDGTLVNLVFKAVADEAAAGDTVIKLHAEDAVDFDGNDIDAVLEEGTVKLLENTLITVGNTSVTATKDVEVPVNISLNNGVWGIRAEFKYDSSLLTFNGIKSGIFAADKDVNYSEKDGTVVIFAEGAGVEDATENGTLFTLQFTAGRKAGNADVEINVIDFINAAEQDLSVKTVNGVVEILPAPSITVGSVETFSEKVTSVPVTISGNSGIISARVEIAYDAENLEFVGVSDGLFKADDTNASAHDGVITVYVENTKAIENISENGVIFNLIFKPVTNVDAEYVLETTVTDDSTINADGEEVKFLGENGVLTVKAHEHNFETVVLDPTCTEDGYNREVCTICDTIKSEVVLPALGHTESEPVVKAATCTEDGYSRIVCSVCGKYLRETVIKALGHDMQVSEVVAPTCKDEGYTLYACSRCDNVVKDDVVAADPVNGHVAGEKVITAEPTYEAAGAYEVRCTLCDAVLESGTIPMLSHITVTVGDGTARPGNEVTVPVTYAGNEGTFILRLNVSYDADKLVYVGAENGEVFAADNVILNKVSDGTLTLYFEADGNTDVSANGVLANLTFKVVDDEANVGDTEVDVAVEDALNLAEEDIYIQTASGTITITPNSTITVNDATVKATEDVEVPVTVELNKGIWTVNAEFKYDPSMLTFKGVKSGAFETLDDVNYSVNGDTVTVFVEGAEIEDFTEDDVLFSLLFTAGKNGGNTPVDVKLIEVINTESEDVDVRGIGGSVEIIPLPALSVGTVEGYANSTVKVPVAIERNPGVFSVRMEIAYDAENLEFTGVSDGMFKADTTNASAHDGVITVFVESDTVENVTGDGVAFYLNFTAKADKDAEYALEAAVIADSTINAAGDEVMTIANDGKIIMKSHAEHTVVSDVIEATCTTDGAKVEKCSVCGEILSSEVIPATGHEWDEGKVVAPDCVNMGYTLYTCAKCGTQEKRNFTDITGHTPGEAVVERAATCSKEGLLVVRCTVCNEILSETPIAKIPHTPGTPRFEQMASCTQDGIVKVNCAVCGEALPDIIEPAWGHLWDDENLVTVPATCEEDGCVKHVCITCGEEEVIEVLPKLGHKWVLKETVPATPFEQGYDLYVCENDETHTKKENFTDYEGLYGDVDYDGDVDSDDAIYLLNYILNPELAPIPGIETIHNNGDFNRDGVVDSDDAIYLLNYSMLPELFPLV